MKSRFFLMLISAMTLTVVAGNYSPAFRNALNMQRSEMQKAVAEKEKEKEKIVSAYLTVQQGCADNIVAKVREAGGSAYPLTDSCVSVHMSLSDICALAEEENILYIETASPVTPQLDLGRESIGAGVSQWLDTGDGILRNVTDYTGDCIIVGVVDKGFNYTNPAFLDDRGGSRIICVWEQGGEMAGASAPSEFGYGVEFEPADFPDVKADISGNTHGTHVAAIAAGSVVQGAEKFCGVAPDAKLILVSYDTPGAGNVNISDAIAYIFARADLFGVPCVINLSLGSQIGPHDGTSTFDTVADALQGPGHLLVGAAGNHGASDVHVCGGGTLRMMAEITPNESGVIDIWGDDNGTPDLAVKVGVMKLSTGAYTELTALDSMKDDDLLYEASGNLNASIAMAGEVNTANGRPHCQLSINMKSIRSGYALCIKVSGDDAEQINAWCDGTSAKFVDNSVADYAAPDRISTIMEIGGTGKRIVSVGAYTTRCDYNIDGSYKQYHLDETLGEIASFSSKGPTADGRQKPEVYAPGAYIISATSPYESTIPRAFSVFYDGEEYSYGYMQGTSSAAPFVTGAVACLLQADPYLDPERLHHILEHCSSEPGDAQSVRLSLPDMLSAIFNDSGVNNIKAPTTLEPIYSIHGYPLKSSSASHLRKGKIVVR